MHASERAKTSKRLGLKGMMLFRSFLRPRIPRKVQIESGRKPKKLAPRRNGYGSSRWIARWRPRPERALLKKP